MKPGRSRRNAKRKSARKPRTTVRPGSLPALEQLEKRELLSLSPLGSEQLINQFTSGNQAFTDTGDAVALIPGGGYMTTWGSFGQDGSGWGIWGRKYVASGAPAGDAFQANTFTTGDQKHSSVSVAADGSYVIAWRSANQDGSGSGVYAQRFAADGAALGSEFLVNTTTQNDQEFPSVTHLSGGTFVIAWSGRGVGDNIGVFGRLFGANGTAIGDEFRINTNTNAVQKLVNVAAISDGGFVAAWASYGSSGGGSIDVFAQRFDGNAAKVGGEFQVNTVTQTQQSYPAVAGSPLGGLVVAWQSKLSDGTGEGIFAQIFNASGQKVGSEFQVSTTSAGDQMYPSAAYDSNGNFVIAWNGQGAGDLDGVFARQFSADGTPQGDEVLVNTTTAGVQQYATVRAAASGYVIAWSGQGAGDTDGAFLRRFGTAPAAAAPSPLEVQEDSAPSQFDLRQVFADSENSDAELTFQIVGNTNPGLFSRVVLDPATGQLMVTYAANAFGTADITVEATDPGGLSGQATITVNVAAVNDAPTAVGILDVEVNEDAVPTAINLHASFADVDNAVADLAYEVVCNSNPALFAAVAVQDGLLTLTYAPNAFGSSNITIRATDPGGLSAETSFAVAVAPVNDAPTAIGIANVAAYEDSEPTVMDLAAAFADVDNSDSELTFAVIGNTHSSLVSTAIQDGQLTLAYAPNASGSSDIIVRATDPGGLSVDTAFTVSVAPVNDAPAAVGIAEMNVDEDSAPTQIDLTTAFADVDNAAGELAFEVIGNTNADLVSTDIQDGTLTLSYAPDAFGAAAITIRATDPDGLSAETTFTVNVAAVNDPPTAVDDAYSLNQNGILVAEPDFGLLVNDNDIDGDPLSAVLVSGPQHGTLTLNADGSFEYIPAAAYIGTDSFTYKAGDGILESAAAAVNLTITRYNPPPTIASLVDAPDPAMSGAGVTLQANGVTDDTAVSQVAFYRDLDANGVLDATADQLLGIDADGSDGWLVSVSTDEFGEGPQTYFAQATDNEGTAGNVATTGGGTGPFAVLEDGQPGYTETGQGWTDAAGGRSENVRVHAAGTGQNKAAWTFEQLPGAYYKVHITWTAGADRASNVPVTIYDGDTVVATATVNERLAPGTFQEDGTWWHYLGTYQALSGVLRVEMADAANGLVVADAVRIIDPVPPQIEVLDPATPTLKIYDAHGRAGDNLMKGDWELGVMADTNSPPVGQTGNHIWSSSSETFTFYINTTSASFAVETDGVGTVSPLTIPVSPNAVKIWANSSISGAGLDITNVRVNGNDLLSSAAEIHILNTGAGTVFQQVLIGNIDCSEGITISGNVTMHWGAIQPGRSNLQFHIVPVWVGDLDADTDNNNKGGVAEQDKNEETLEETSPGKYIAVDRTAASIARKELSPLYANIGDPSSWTADASFRFVYKPSTGAPSSSRILNLYMPSSRSPVTWEDWSHSSPTRAGDMGVNSGTKQAEYYVQAVAEGEATISLEYRLSDTGTWTEADFVYFTAIDSTNIDCGCGCGSTVQIDPVGRLMGTSSDAYGQAPRAVGNVNAALPRLVSTANGLAVLEKDEALRRIYDAAGTTPPWTQWTTRDENEDWGISERTYFEETSPTGLKLSFAKDEAIFGRLEISDPVGDEISYYDYYTDGRLKTVTTHLNRLENGQWAKLIATYTYVGDTDAYVTITRDPEEQPGRKVQETHYALYGANDLNGNLGDVKLATISDGNGTVIEQKYYRYYKGGTGSNSLLKMSFTGQAFERLYAAYSGYNPELEQYAFELLPDSAIRGFATEYLEYDTLRRVTLHRSAGSGCSLCDGSSDVRYAYDTSAFDPLPESWNHKTVTTFDGGVQTITYTNFRGETILEDRVAGGQHWVTYSRYDVRGNLLWSVGPSAVTGYDDGVADLDVDTSSNGLIQGTEYYATTTAVLDNPATTEVDETAPGGVEGYYYRSYVQEGETGRKVYTDAVDYIGRAGSEGTVYYTNSSTRYRNDDGTGAQTTNYSYAFVDGSVQIASRTTISPGVPTSQNGDYDDPDYLRSTSVDSYDSFGRTVWSKDAGGFINYTQYDARTGAVVKQIADADLSVTGDFDSANLDLLDGLEWSTPANGGAHLVTTYEVDTQGRTTKVTDPDGVVSYTVYLDAARETRTYAGWHAVTGGYTTTGPVQVWRDDPGRGYSESFSFTAPVWTADEPDGAEDIGAIQSLSRSIVNAAGQMVESREYFSLDGISYSTDRDLGTEGTHYLATRYVYDTRGRSAVTSGPTAGGPSVYGSAIGAMNAPAEVLYSDNFTRANSTVLGNNDKAGGGAIQAAWAERTANSGFIEGNRLRMGVETSGTSDVWPMHNFVDPAILAAGAFTVSFDYTATQATNYWLGFVIGAGDTAAINVSNSMLQPKPFGILFRGNGQYVSYGSGDVQEATGTFDANRGTGSKTWHIEITVDGINGFGAADGGTVTCKVDGQAIDLDESDAESLAYAFTGWTRPGQNYLLFETTGYTTSYIDNLAVSSSAARNDVATLSKGGSATINVLANDGLPGAGRLSLASVTQPSFGTTTITQDGKILYTPTANFFGFDTFSYTVTDGQGYNDTATVNVTVDAASLKTHTFYDGLSRTKATWTGSDDILPAVGDADLNGYDDNDLTADGVIDLRDFRYWVSQNPGETTGPEGTDMVKVSASVYDSGGVGDSNLTTNKTYVAEGVSLDTAYAYDWRGRQIASRGPDGVAAVYTYDNLGQTTTVQTYADADNDLIPSGYQPGDELNVEGGELRAQSESLYDDQGRVYRSITREVNPDGTLGDESLAYDTWYDARGQVIKTADPAGLFGKTVYDGLGRSTISYTSFDADESGYAAAGDVVGDTVVSLTQTIYSGSRVSEVRQGTTTANAVATQQYEYDPVSGRVTSVKALRPITTLTGTAADYAETTYGYDAAGRQNVTISPDPDGTGGNPATESVAYFDLLGRGTAQELRTADVSNALLASSTSQYNSFGQLASTRTYEVSNGLTGDYLQTSYAYDALGRSVKTTQPGGAFSKTELNPWGRVLGQYVGTGEGATSALSDDIIVEQTIPQYDAIGRVWMTASYQRHDGNTTSTGPLTPSNARVTYDVSWFDSLSRAKWAASYGTNGGTAITGQFYDFDGDGAGSSYASAAMTVRTEANADNYILTQYAFDGFGRNYLATDNAGRQTLQVFDAAGLRTHVVENYVDFAIVNGVETGTGGGTSADQDRVTKYVYNTAGLLTEQIALDTNGDGTLGDDQVTDYIYAMDLNASAAGSPVLSGSLLRATVYPDAYVGQDQRAAAITALENPQQTGRDFVETTYNAAGLTATSTDQRGVRHEYAYDDLGRLTADAVTDYPSGQETGAANFDASILRIQRSYDVQGRLASITSFNAASGGAAVNGIAWAYDSWGNVAASYQNHAAAASTSDPSVQYAYAKPGDTGSGNSDSVSVRLSKVTYPNGREVFYNYGSAGSIGDVLNRIDNIAASATPASADIYAQYAYLGAGTIVRVSRPSQANGLTLNYDPAGNHTYAGWDRFGRVVNQQWTTTAGGIVDQYRYGYDEAGNRIWRQVGPDMTTPPTGLDELYSYDGLSRLIETQRGDLDLTATPAIADQTDGQAWDLDLLGNWQSTTEFCGPIQYRTHDDANQITAIDGSDAQVAYDAAGNMIRIPSALNQTQTHHAVYDAWNRMTAVYADDGDGTFEPGAGDWRIGAYQYDGQRRRIVTVVYADGVANTQTDTFFNENWQTLEERSVELTSQPVNQSTTQFLWDIRYIDAPVLRWHDGNAVVYYVNDANFNVTALVDATTGAVVERCTYEPYGNQTVLEADWSPDADNASDVGNTRGFAGAARDAETGLVLMRWRYDHVVLGRFLTNDPARDGMNLYQYCGANPLLMNDAMGLKAGITGQGDHDGITVEIKDEAGKVIGSMNADFHAAGHMNDAGKPAHGPRPDGDTKPGQSASSGNSVDSGESSGPDTSSGSSSGWLGLFGGGGNPITGAQGRVDVFVAPCGMAGVTREIEIGNDNDLIDFILKSAGRDRAWMLSQLKVAKPHVVTFNAQNGFETYRFLTQNCNDYVDAALDALMGYDWCQWEVITDGDDLIQQWDERYDNKGNRK